MVKSKKNKSNNKGRDWNHLIQYAGEWVMLADDEVTVVAHDKILKEAARMADENGYPDSIAFRVPDKDALGTYMGSHFVIVSA